MKGSLLAVLGLLGRVVFATSLSGLAVAPHPHSACFSGTVSGLPSAGDVVVEYAIDEAFSQPVESVLARLEADGSFSRYLRGLTEGETYFWRIRVKSVEDGSELCVTPTDSFVARSVVASSPHIFLESGTLVLERRVQDAQVLVVGGGGGGTGGWGAGGGAGGLIYEEGVTLLPGTYAVTVGAGGGGTADYSMNGANGEDSVVSYLDADLYRAIGGGGGGARNKDRKGWPGGSGGGGAANASSYGAGGAGTPGQGHDGGTTTWQYAMGGGGGAGEAGHDGALIENIDGIDHGKAGDGGDGLPCSITGEEVWYAGGGGGATSQAAGSYVCDGYASGGRGGGGDGGDASKSTSGADGEPGTGGGGGGGSRNSPRNYPGGNGGSGIVVVRYAEPDLEDSLPIVYGLGVVEVAIGEATVSGRVDSVGAEATSLSVSVEYGLSPDELVFTQVVSPACGTGAISCPLAGLRAGTTWYARIVAANDCGEAVESDVFTFSTLPDVYPAEQAFPGLYQSYRVSTANNFQIPGTSTKVNYATGYVDFDVHYADGLWTRCADIVPGALVALTTADFEWNGITYPFGASYQNYAYFGYVFMEAGKTYRIAKHFDDALLLKVDDGAWQKDSNWTNLTTWNIACTKTGWHPIWFYFYNSSAGGVVDNAARNILTADGENIGVGFAESSDGSTFGSYEKVFDLTGERFRTAAAAVMPVVADGWSCDGGRLIASVSVSCAVEGGELRMYAAAVNGGADASKWTLVKTYALSESVGTQAIAVDVDLPSDARQVRFAVSDVFTDTTAWSPTVSVSLSAFPVLTDPLARTVGGTTATLGANLANTGGSGACAIVACLSPTNALGESEFALVPDLENVGEFSLALVDLIPETTYECVFKVANRTTGLEGQSDAFSFTTLGPATILTHGATVDGTSATVTAAVAPGAGETTAVVRFGPSADAMTEYPAAIDGETGVVSLTFDDLDLGRKYTYEIVLVTRETSASGTEYSWTTNSGVQTDAVYIGDTTTYTWKGAASGNWNDPEMWTPSKTPCLGYPTESSTAQFGAGDLGPIVVTFTADGAVQDLKFNAATDIMFRADDPSVRFTVGKSTTLVKGMKLRVDSLYVSAPMASLKADAECHLTNGASLVHEIGNAVPAANSSFWLSGGSTLKTTGEFYVRGSNVTFRVENSTMNCYRLFYYAENEFGRCTITVAGTNPVVTAGMFVNRYSDTVATWRNAIVFEVPVGGYLTPPIVSTGGEGFMGSYSWMGGVPIGVDISIHPKSPALKAPGKFDTQLVASHAAIGRVPEGDYAIFAAPPPEGCYFYPVPEAAAKEYWAHIKGGDGMMILVR